MSIEWYFMRDGMKHGPVSSKQLKEFADSGKIKPTDLIWKEGLSDWRPAAFLRVLFDPTSNREVEPDHSQEEVSVDAASEKPGFVKGKRPFCVTVMAASVVLLLGGYIAWTKFADWAQFPHMKSISIEVHQADFPEKQSSKGTTATTSKSEVSQKSDESHQKQTGNTAGEGMKAQTLTVKTDSTPETVRVVLVVDGNTVITKRDLLATKFRLMGVAISADASFQKNALRDLLQDREVIIQFDKQVSWDKDGIRFAYLIDPLAQVCINTQLIQEGFAPYRRTPTCTYNDTFAQAEEHAKSHSAGLWSEANVHLVTRNSAQTSKGSVAKPVWLKGTQARVDLDFAVYDIAFSQDDTMLACSSVRGVHISKGDLNYKTVNPAHRVYAVAFSNDDSCLFTNEDEGGCDPKKG